MFSRLRLPISSVILMLCAFHLSHLLLASDGIPDNCEYTNAAFYRASIFPRYEPQNRRLVLVNWGTGETVQEIGADLADTFILGWSPDCRYLATAVGSPESMDTVVWDTTNNTRIGVVPDAHGKPHTVTWGPHNFIMVETCSGAILWNVPTNVQMKVTESFDWYTARNFSRLRWDGKNMQVTGNLAVGGREVYDMNTGQQIALVANIDDSQPFNYYRVSDETNRIAIGGKEYACHSGFSPYVALKYDPANGAVYLAAHLNYRKFESILMLEDQLSVSWFQPRGWSRGCRYVAASLGIEGKDASDTYVWDVIEKRRVGVVRDARKIVHPIHWSPEQDYAIVETRDGGYLWHLLTDTKILLTSNAETALTGESAIHNFHQIMWNIPKHELLAVDVGSKNTVISYDLTTGAITGEYSGYSTDQVEFKLSPDSSHLIIFGASSGSYVTVWNRTNGVAVNVDVSQYLSRYYGRISDERLKITPDNRYLVACTYQHLSVWDLTTLSPDGIPSGVPNFYYDNAQICGVATFIDNVTLQAFDSPIVTFNILTGERIQTTPAATPIPPATPLDGQTGFSPSGRSDSFSRRSSCGRIPRYVSRERSVEVVDAVTGDVVQTIADDINFTEHMGWSPDCRYLFGVVSLLRNADLPPYDITPVDDYAHLRSRSTQMTLWDVQTGEQIASLDHFTFRGRYPYYVWSPGGERLYVQLTSGSYLIDLAARQPVLLTFNPRQYGSQIYYGSLSSYPRVYWDYKRGQVIVSGYAFDMQTGKERYTLSGGAARISSDGDSAFGLGFQSAVIWDLDTLERIEIDVDPWGSSYSGTVADMSPDNRYFVIARGMVRIWNLTELADEINDRDPVYSWSGPFELVRGIKFIDNVTVELITSRLVGKTYHMNVETGEYWLVED